MEYKRNKDRYTRRFNGSGWKDQCKMKLNWPHNDVLPYILVDFQSVAAAAAAIVAADNEEIANVFVVAVSVWQNYLSFVMQSM